MTLAPVLVSATLAGRDSVTATVAAEFVGFTLHKHWRGALRLKRRS
jgi:hypothetical protein